MNDFLNSILDLRLDAKTKGIPLAQGSVRLGDVDQQGWNILRGDMMLPLLTLRNKHLKNNLSLMRSFAEYHGVSLAPHGKSSMSPQLCREQIEVGGAWGISAATVQHAAVVAASGVENIIIPNQVIGRANVEQFVMLKRAYPKTHFYSLVDSQETIEQLIFYGKPLLTKDMCFQVLPEVGHSPGRTGVRTMEQAIKLIQAVMKYSDTLDLAGIECYESTISRENMNATLKAIDQLLDLTVNVFNYARSEKAFGDREEIILTAGGSAYFDRTTAKFKAAATKKNTRIVLRGGSYMTYDHGFYYKALHALDERGGLEGMTGHITAATDFTPALELWAMVQSMQDPGIAIVNMGIRDLPYDLGYPMPMRQYRDGQLLCKLDLANPIYEIINSNDQHCYLRYPQGSDIRIGDLFAFGISHPCTAFDKWDVLYRVDEEFNIIGALKTFF